MIVPQADTEAGAAVARVMCEAGASAVLVGDGFSRLGAVAAEIHGDTGAPIMIFAGDIAATTSARCSRRWSRSSSPADARRPKKPDGGVRVALIASAEVDDEGETKQQRAERKEAAKREGGQTRKHGWRLMKETVGAHPHLMILGIVAGLVWAVARVSVPLLAGAAIDHGIAEDDTGVTLAFTAAIVAVGAVQAVGTGLRRYAAFGLAWRVETDIRMRLVAHLQRLHFAFHDQAQTGQLMAYANTDIQQINNVILLVPLTIASTIQMAAVVVILVLRSPGLALFALGLLPLLNFSATRFNHRMYPVGMQLQKELSDVSGVVEESVTGVRVVKGFGVERMQRAASRDRGRQRLRPVDGPGPAARELHAAHRPAAGARARRHPLVRRSPGARRQPDCRRHRVGQPLRRHAHLAAAHDRHARRSVAAIGRGGRSHRLDPRDRSRDRRRAERARRCPTVPARCASNG